MRTYLKRLVRKMTSLDFTCSRCGATVTAFPCWNCGSRR